MKKLTQRKTAPPLCKNCEGAKFPVERKGKNGFLFAPRQSQEKCGAVSGKARVARTLLSACQSHPPAQGSQNRRKSRLALSGRRLIPRTTKSTTVLVEEPAFRPAFGGNQEVEEPAVRPAFGGNQERALAPVAWDRARIVRLTTNADSPLVSAPDQRAPDSFECIRESYRPHSIPAQAVRDAVSGKARVARTLLSACQSHPPAQGSQRPNRDRDAEFQLSTAAGGGAQGRLFDFFEVFVLLLDLFC